MSLKIRRFAPLDVELVWNYLFSMMAIFLPFWGNGCRKKVRKLKIKKVDDKTMVICKFRLIGRNIHCSLRSQ